MVSGQTLFSWIRNGLPGVPGQPRVWRAFLDYSRLTEQAARTALRWGTLPQIRFVRMPDLEVNHRSGRVSHGGPRWRGFFSPQAPNAIFLWHRLHTLGWQQNQIVALVLHELVHWGYFHTGGPPEADVHPCRGDRFELAAYGRAMTATLPTAEQIEADAIDTSMRRVDEVFGGVESIIH